MTVPTVEYYTPPKPNPPERSSLQWIFVAASIPLLLLLAALFPPPPAARVPGSIVIILAGGFFIIRHVDVRLVLGISAAMLFALAGDMPSFFVKFAAEMANAKTVVPICSAMAFAYVLRRTECDQHLVHALLIPARKVRFLLIPGGALAAFVVNSAVVSQASTATIVGPVLIPLLLAARVSAATAAATLVLGASMGGELFNPGAVEIAAISKVTGIGAPELVRRIMPYNIVASGIALATFWFLTARRERAALAAAGYQDEPLPSDPFHINPAKALVPFLPIVLLFFSNHIPLAGKIEPHAFVAASMLLGVTAAVVVSPRHAQAAAPAFFEGAGFAYTHIISLIITAFVFTEGLKATGLISLFAEEAAAYPKITLVAAFLITWALSTVSGSGMAPATAMINALLPIANKLSLDAVRLGAMTSVSAQFGRTMSPVAAVVMVASALTHADKLQIAKLVAIPLMTGGAALLVCALLHLL